MKSQIRIKNCDKAGRFSRKSQSIMGLVL